AVRSMAMTGQRERAVEFCQYSRYTWHLAASFALVCKIGCGAHRPHRVRTGGSNAYFEDLKDAGFHGRLSNPHATPKRISSLASGKRHFPARTLRLRPSRPSETIGR